MQLWSQQRFFYTSAVQIKFRQKALATQKLSLTLKQCLKKKRANWYPLELIGRGRGAPQLIFNSYLGTHLCGIIYAYGNAPGKCWIVLNEYLSRGVGEVGVRERGGGRLPPSLPGWQLYGRVVSCHTDSPALNFGPTCPNSISPVKMQLYCLVRRHRAGIETEGGGEYCPCQLWRTGRLAKNVPQGRALYIMSLINIRKTKTLTTSPIMTSAGAEPSRSIRRNTHLHVH